MTAFSHCRRQQGLFQDHILISNLKETEGLEKLLEFAEAVFAQGESRNCCPDSQHHLSKAHFAIFCGNSQESFIHDPVKSVAANGVRLFLTLRSA